MDDQKTPHQSKETNVPVNVKKAGFTDIARKPVPSSDTTPSTLPEPTASDPIEEPQPPAPVAKQRRLVFGKFKRWQVIVVGLVGLTVLTSAGALAWHDFHITYKSAPVAHSHKPKPKPVPTTVADPMTGVQVTPSAAAQPIVGVMIENLDPNARPQSGLGAADVVYEALAEGGITRFLALFQEPLPPVIGPVRSLRPYYLDWGLEYNAPVAHAGGSIPALSEIVPLGLKNINALEYDGSYFYRTSDREAPHNLYTNSQLLTALVAKLGFATAPSLTPLPRKKDAAEAKPAAPTININFSYSDYAVQYNYDSTTNSYARIMAGTPHIDRNTGQQIYVKNIVVEFVPTSYGTQADGDPMTIMQLVGQGKAYVFEDGGVTIGTWNKSSDAGQTKLLDANGKPIQFDAGNTWYEVVPVGNAVTY